MIGSKKLKYKNAEKNMLPEKNRGEKLKKMAFKKFEPVHRRKK
jgi:hypothetical protein